MRGRENEMRKGDEGKERNAVELTFPILAVLFNQ
jgi:hypothetical protein